MDRATFEELVAPRGQAALADATALVPSDAMFLACFEKLRKHHAPELVKAALEMVILRRKASVKFTYADRMYFTREALEQATGEVAAWHRAKRLAPYGVVADLGCGIGGDALALAASGLRVHAVESDPLRLAIARANARAIGLIDQIVFHPGDALTIPLPEVMAAFADPARRAGNRRHLDPEDYTPPLSALRGRFPPDFPLAVKIAPGVPLEDIGDLGAEAEFVSVDGEMKECVLWFGPLRTAARRATILPAGVTIASDDPAPMPPLVGVAEYVFDPDPTIVRAGLAGHLARELDIAPVDPVVQLFTGTQRLVSPLVTTYRVEFAARYHAMTLRQHLRAQGVGRVTVVKRGSMIDADELIRKLKLTGSEHRVILLARAAGEPVMIVCERVTASSV